MLLDQIFTPFLAESPLSVMARATVEHALTAASLDQLFQQHAQTQYTRDLLFSSVVELLSLVVTNVQRSVSAAYKTGLVNVSVSLTSVYNKLQGIEDHVSAELVRHTAQRLEPVIRHLGGLLPEPVPGYRMRILDGNHLAATEHRLRETRDNAAAPLPGQTMAVLTNLPAAVAARTVAKAYRKRWRIEGAFQELTVTLHCEVNTLCYPRAALFAFCVAVAAYNVLGALKAALRAAHGAEKIEKDLSGYYVALEIAGVHRGMMIAIPAEHWYVFATMTAEQLAEVLRELASTVQLRRYQKHARGPKKPPVKRHYSKKHPHVSTAQLLEARRVKKQAAKK